MASFTETDISATAVAVAHFRALESSRDDALFHDEFAALFVDASGLPVSDIGLSDVTSNRVYLSVAVRTHWLDAGVVDAVAAGCRQVVLLGAGLDARAARLGVRARFFEIDLPNVLAFKRSVMDERGGEYVDVAADLTAADWPARLIEAGFDPSQPTVWIAEGILIYFDSATNDRIITAVSELSAAGSRLLCGHFGAGSLTEAQTKEMTQRTSSAGYGFRSWITDPKTWLAERDWDVTATTIKAHGATLGRELPYEETPGREIAWLVAAERRSECA
ncbi:class I SAM-dependent methyltransferase [Nocardia sp. NPDC058705]|uniref:class I SAM-dependent methyltransferase n=1 Tax=Nocardia sp. NPDC058705 TaxID=3346609 RepID=UPI00367BD68C